MFIEKSFNLDLHYLWLSYNIDSLRGNLTLRHKVTVQSCTNVRVICPTHISHLIHYISPPMSNRVSTIRQGKMQMQMSSNVITGDAMSGMMNKCAL